MDICCKVPRRAMQSDRYISIIYNFSEATTQESLIALKGLFTKFHVKFRPINRLPLYFNFKFVGPTTLPTTLTGKIGVEIEKTPYIGRNFTLNLYIKYLQTQRKLL